MSTNSVHFATLSDARRVGSAAEQVASAGYTSLNLPSLNLPSRVNRGP